MPWKCTKVWKRTFRGKTKEKKSDVCTSSKVCQWVVGADWGQGWASSPDSYVILSKFYTSPRASSFSVKWDSNCARLLGGGGIKQPAEIAAAAF